MHVALCVTDELLAHHWGEAFPNMGNLELTAAREATFGEPLSNESLGENPCTGQNAFSDEELDLSQH